MDQLNTGAENTEPKKITIDVLREELLVGKQTTVTGTVRIVKKVHEVQQEVSATLTNTNVHIEKVPVNQFVDKAPGVRYEGDVMIVPVLKEVLVTEKKLMLVEEWHVRQKITTSEQHENVPVKHEEIIIERTGKDMDNKV